MINDNAFDNQSITGSGGALVSGSGIFFELDFGIVQPIPFGPDPGDIGYSGFPLRPGPVSAFEFFQTGLLAGRQSFDNNSITGSGGPLLSGSGIFFALDFAFPYQNGELLTTDTQTGISPPPPPPLNFFKPYSFFFQKK